MDWKLGEYYSCLGEKGRADFLEWLTNRPLPSDKHNSAINYDYCVDYRDDVYRAGGHLVYLYTDEKGVPFYVGKGYESRALDLRGRNDAFEEKFNNNGVNRVFAISSNISEKEALSVETLVINELLNRGWRLTNAHKISIDSEKHRSLSETHPKVLMTLNNITKVALSSLLDDVERFSDTGKVVRKNKTSLKLA